MRLVVLLSVLCAVACAHTGSAGPGFPTRGRWIDMSHTYDASTIYWPTSDPFELEVVSHGYTDQGFFYAANAFRTAEHGGTHLDAPIHFAEGKRAVDELPIDQLIGPAVVVDVSAQAAQNADYQVSVTDLQAWEAEHGRIPDGAIVLLHTGFGKRWPDAASYLGTAERGADALAKLHFPGLHAEAARWLTRERAPGALGLDTASIDRGQTTKFESHVELFLHDVPAIENVANLHLLPPTGAWIVALPMKIGDGSGAPVRVAAWLPE
ncbi:MAG: cyclase [Planctomycetota bacterium]|nr:MAG: cyclase [Planctomycetota bacterium]